jgi:hypothetical protein
MITRDIREVIMTDLARLGLTLVGFAASVVAAGVVIGLIGATLTRH